MYTVLLADDELIEREYLKSIFIKHPKKYIVIGEASNGQQAIKLAQDLKPDIIIMDINMPLINGLEAARTIKKIHENTIVILNSAYSEFEFAQKAISYNLDSYLIKPTCENEIIETVQSSIYRNRGITKSLVKKSQESSMNFPYELIDDLITSLETNDIELLEYNIGIYLRYLHSRKARDEDIRIFIINTIFTVMRIIKQTYPEETSCLLKCEAFINDISQAEFSYIIFTATENFFEMVFILVKNNNIYTDIIETLEKYLDKNFNKEITLDSLSDCFHFSPAYLSRKFHKGKGITINHYLRNKRVEYSIHLLKYSNIPIGSIANKSGYKNISHFNRVFKEVTGSSPSEYRKKE